MKGHEGVKDEGDEIQDNSGNFVLLITPERNMPLGTSPQACAYICSELLSCPLSTLPKKRRDARTAGLLERVNLPTVR